MPSSSPLTRHVFRRLLANEPILHPGCLRRQAYSLLTPAAMPYPPPRPHHAYPLHVKQRRRTLFSLGLFCRPKRNAREADLTPGIEKMMEYAKMERMRARLPPPAEVAGAFNKFFNAKIKQQSGIEDTQAELALQSLRYVVEAQKAARPLLPRAAMEMAAHILIRNTPPTSHAHLDLARALYDERSDTPPFLANKAVQAYVAALCRTGDTAQARDLVLEREGAAGQVKPDIASSQSDAKEADETVLEDVTGLMDNQTPSVVRLWKQLLAGFAKEDDEGNVLRTLRMMQERGIDHQRFAPRAMLNFYLRRNDLAGLRQWWPEFCRKIHTPAAVSPAYYLREGAVVAQVLRWCLDHDELTFGHEVVRDAMQTSPWKPVWDAIFVWAAGTKKSVDEINRMLTVMETSNESISDRSLWRTPDIATINALVEFAISRQDPYMAERFIAMGRERKIEPDARTYVLQMEYRLSVDDVDGALIAYKSLQAMDLSSNEDVPAVNNLIVALCTSRRHDFDTIMNVAADLSERQVRFEPLTVSTLSILHLSRDEIHDVIDLLNTHAFHYSSTERESIRKTIVAYCLDPATPTSRAWDAYTILRSIFEETPRDQRTEVMQNFFHRNRPDMAVHVFNHMRTHSRVDTIPATDTYVAAFNGCAKLRDLESLEVLHNQLKLDYTINMSTYLYNSLIIAYSACDQPREALAFWDELVASSEGPSYNSVHCALRACEKSPFGDMKAQDIWARLRRRNVELDQSMWASYIAALAGNGDNEMALGKLDEAVDKAEVEVDAFLLASVLNAAPGQVKQSEIEGWARERHPTVWEKVEDLGIEVGEDGMRSVKIDRSVTP